jgi:adenine-specific DNA-methyltransferase
LVVVYADACLLSPEFLQRHGLVFKKIPRDITRL